MPAIIEAAHFLVSIQLKVVASNVIVPAVAGRKFIPRAVFLRFTDRTGSGVGATVSIGNEASTYENLCSGQVVNAPQGSLFEMAMNASSKVPVLDINSSGIRINVTNASTFTTDVAEVYIEGYLVS